MFAVEIGEFADAQAGGVEGFENSSVAQASNVVFFGRGEESFEFFAREEFDGSSGQFTEFDFFGSESFDVLLDEVLEKSAKRDDVIILRFDGEIAATTEMEAEILDLIEGEFFDFEIFPGIFFGPVGETSEVVAIIDDRARGLVFADFAVLEIFFEKVSHDAILRENPRVWNWSLVADRNLCV